MQDGGRNTPQKSANKSSQIVANEQCRFCNCKLVLRYGKTNYLSTENLYIIPKKKEYSGPEFDDLQNKTLSEICLELGFEFPQSSSFSDRICKQCGRNLRSTYRFFKRLKSAKERDKCGDMIETRCEEEPRFKRQLPTTISPDRQSHKRTSTGTTVGVKKSLNFGVDKENNSAFFEHLNIEEIINHMWTEFSILQPKIHSFRAGGLSNLQPRGPQAQITRF